MSDFHLRHKQVSIRVGHRWGDVDEQIAPLIEQIWLANIDTELSCEENWPGIAWIFFPSPRDAQKFLNIVAPFDLDEASVYQRVRQCGNYDYDPAQAWSVDVVLTDELEDELYQRRQRWTIGISIRFPISDMPVLMARLKEHNAKRNCSARTFRTAVSNGGV